MDRPNYKSWTGNLMCAINFYEGTYVWIWIFHFPPYLARAGQHVCSKSKHLGSTDRRVVRLFYLRVAVSVEPNIKTVAQD